QVLDALLQLVHGLDHVEVLPRAARAGDEVDATGTQAQRLENVETDLDLLDRIGRQRDADGVANALGEQHAQTDSRLHGAGTQAAGLGDPQVQRLDDLGRQLTVGGHRHEHVRGLHADLEVLEVQAIEVLDMTQCGLHQRFRGRFAVLFLQVLLQRAGVDADADRDALVTGGIDHRAYAILATDVARIDAQAVDTQLGHAQGDLVVEVDIRHQRYLDLLADSSEGFCSIHARYRDAHDVGTG